MENTRPWHKRGKIEGREEKEGGRDALQTEVQLDVAESEARAGSLWSSLLSNPTKGTVVQWLGAWEVVRGRGMTASPTIVRRAHSTLLARSSIDQWPGFYPSSSRAGPAPTSTTMDTSTPDELLRGPSATAVSRLGQRSRMGQCSTLLFVLCISSISWEVS